jgi:hypothetical protein
MTDFKIEEKYLVVKRSDLEQFFSQFQGGIFATAEEQKAMDSIPFNEVLKGIREMRESDRKNPNPRYWVCNQDEPYADMIIRIIELGERAKS